MTASPALNYEARDQLGRRAAEALRAGRDCRAAGAGDRLGCAAVPRGAAAESLDARVHDVASQLQCPICNGESVADSPSGLASEMRALIRQKLAQGESEQQVIQYFEARYGDTILEAPPMSGFTTLIWLPPVLMLVVGGYLVFVMGKEWSVSRASGALAGIEPDEDEALDLSDEERRRLRETLMRELERDEGIPFGAATAREERK